MGLYITRTHQPGQAQGPHSNHTERVINIDAKRVDGIYIDEVDEAKNHYELVLYGHADCSLCDRLEAMIEPYLQDPGREVTITLVKRDITSSSDWQKFYRTRIPVLTYGDSVILEGRPEPAQVAAAMTQLG